MSKNREKCRKPRETVKNVENLITVKIVDKPLKYRKNFEKSAKMLKNLEKIVKNVKKQEKTSKKKSKIVKNIEKLEKL